MPSTCPVGRFLLRIRISENGCWEWQNALANGYGYLRISKHVLVQTHRYAYEGITGNTIPIDLQIDHLCRNRKCCNPSHLEIVTHKVNSLRGIGAPAKNAKATHCVHGHPFNKENTYYRHDNGRIGRQCKLCGKERKRLYFRKNFTQVLNPKTQKYVLINTKDGIIVSHHPRRNTPFHHVKIKQ